MSAKIGDAPDGQNASLQGTEKLPLTGSKWAFTAQVSKLGHTHADSDNGGAVNHSALTGAGTSLHVPTYSSDSSTYLNGDGDWIQPEHTALSGAGTSLHVPVYSSDSGTFLSGTGEWLTPAGSGDVYDSDIIFTDITTGNADSDSHGFLLKLSMDTAKFLRADGSWQAPPAGGTVFDSDVVFSDTTANNADSDQHGFLPKLSGDSTEYLNGDGEWTTPSGGGGGFTQVIDEDGTTFANFTAVTGTWSSDGTVIKQTDTAAAQYRCYLTAKKDTSHIVIEAEIQLKNSGTDRIGGILVGYDGGASAAALVRLNQTGTVDFVQDEVAIRLQVSATISIDTWYKLRVVSYSGGNACSAYLDGTYIGTAGMLSALGNISQVGLLAYQSQVWFRNIKAWNLTLPA